MIRGRQRLSSRRTFSYDQLEELARVFEADAREIVPMDRRELEERRRLMRVAEDIRTRADATIALRILGFVP